MSHTERVDPKQDSIANKPEGEEEWCQSGKNFYQVKLESLRSTIHQMRSKMNENKEKFSKEIANTLIKKEKDLPFSHSVESENSISESKTMDDRANKNKYSPQSLESHYSRKQVREVSVQTENYEQTYKLKYETSLAEINRLNQLLEEREKYYEEQANELKKDVLSLKEMALTLSKSNKQNTPSFEKKSVTREELKELKYSIDNIKGEIEKAINSPEEDKLNLNYTNVDNENDNSSKLYQFKSHGKSRKSNVKGKANLAVQCRMLLNDKRSKERNSRINEISNSPYATKKNARSISRPKLCENCYKRLSKGLSTCKCHRYNKMIR